MHKEAEEALFDARLAGDLAVAAFFGGSKKGEREELRQALGAKLEAWRLSREDPSSQPPPRSGEPDPVSPSPPLPAPGRGDRGVRSSLTDLTQTAADLRAGPNPVTPFHWELELPEVFDRKNPGFDAIVGNPPFAGKNTLANSNAPGYPDWLKNIHEESHGNSDLVAHFFRRAFNLLRRRGALGLIATNTISQGDTRATGLRWICTNGGTIYDVRKRVMWPGMAAVVISVVHIFKGPHPGPFVIDHRTVPRITAYLFHAGGHESPAALKANEGKSFQGSIVLGMGFTFDDTDKKGVASPLSDMRRLIAKDPRNVERIFPYLGGAELNDSPTHSHHRYVINFGEMTEKEAWEWPDLMLIIEAKVKPERFKQKREIRRRYWWRFGETAPALYRAIQPLDHVIAIARVGQHGAFTLLGSNIVYSE